MKAFMTQNPEFADEAKRSHIRPLFFHLLNPYLLVSKKPVEKFEDLKGMRIRIWGEDMPRLVQAAGGKPLNLFLPDIYKAMESNVLDACLKKMEALGKGDAARQTVTLWKEIRSTVSCGKETSAPETGSKN